MSNCIYGHLQVPQFLLHMLRFRTEEFSSTVLYERLLRRAMMGYCVTSFGVEVLLALRPPLALLLFFYFFNFPSCLTSICNRRVMTDIPLLLSHSQPMGYE